MKYCVFLIAAAVLTTSCAVRKYAVKELGGALVKGTGTFSSDNDPELVRDASAFSLKLIEALLEQSPKNPNLLLAVTSGFTQYTAAFVFSEADYADDRAAAAAMRQRAAKLFIRARDYGMRGLELKHPNFAADLKANPKGAAATLTAKEVPFMYWTALSWAGALAASRNMFMLGEIPRIEALIGRALEQNDAYDEGAAHTFMIAFEMEDPTAKGDRAARAKQHFERAVQLSKGRQAGPYAAYAEHVLVPLKDRAQFEAMLKKALAVDVNADPNWRVLNLVIQRRARWLLSRTDKLFP